MSEDAHVDLQAEKGKDGEREERKDDDITQILHRLDHSSHDGLQTFSILKIFVCLFKGKKGKQRMMINDGHRESESTTVKTVSQRYVPGIMATVLSARKTRNVRRAAKLPRSMPIVTYLRGHHIRTKGVWRAQTMSMHDGSFKGVVSE